MVGMGIERRAFTPTPADAVADAMMNAQFIFVRKFVVGNPTGSVFDLDRELEAKSRGKCN